MSSEQRGGAPASPDEYAATHMAGGAVLARDKLVSGRTYQLLMLVPAMLFALGMIGCVAGAIVVGGAAAMGLAAGAVGAALMTAMFVAMWVTGTVIRTVVTKDELHVQCGVLGPRIPIERIKSCRVGEQHNRLRTGHRFEDGMWTASYLLAFGEYVEVVYTNDRGRDRRVLFSATDPHGVAVAVNRAREQTAGAVAGERIPAAPPVAEAEPETEAADESQEERERHARE